MWYTSMKRSTRCNAVTERAKTAKRSRHSIGDWSVIRSSLHACTSSESCRTHSGDAARSSQHANKYVSESRQHSTYCGCIVERQAHCVLVEKQWSRIAHQGAFTTEAHCSVVLLCLNLASHLPFYRCRLIYMQDYHAHVQFWPST